MVRLHQGELAQGARRDRERQFRSAQRRLHLAQIAIGHVEHQRVLIRPLDNKARGVIHRSETPEKGHRPVRLERPLELKADIIEIDIAVQGVVGDDHIGLLALLAAPGDGLLAGDRAGVRVAVGRDRDRQQFRAVDAQRGPSYPRADVRDETHRYLAIRRGDARYGRKSGNRTRLGGGEILAEQLASRTAGRYQILLVKQIVIIGGHPCRGGGRVLDRLRLVGRGRVGHEIVTCGRIGIVGMDKGPALGIVLPFRRSLSIKKQVVSASPDRDRGQVVDIGLGEILRQGPAAVAVHRHLCRILEAHRLQLGIGQFIDPVLLDRDPHPASLGQGRARGIRIARPCPQREQERHQTTINKTNSHPLN